MREKILSGKHPVHFEKKEFTGKKNMQKPFLFFYSKGVFSNGIVSCAVPQHRE